MDSSNIKGEQKLIPHPDTHCHQWSHPPFILLRAHSSFLKNYFLSYKRFIFLSPFPIKMAFKSEFYAIFLVIHFSLVIYYVWIIIHVNKFLPIGCCCCLLLLICPLLKGPQPRTQKSRWKIIFPPLHLWIPVLGAGCQPAAQNSLLCSHPCLLSVAASASSKLYTETRFQILPMYKLLSDCISQSYYFLLHFLQRSGELYSSQDT